MKFQAGSLPLKKPGATPILPMTVKELQKWTQEYIPSDKKVNINLIKVNEQLLITILV